MKTKSDQPEQQMEVLKFIKHFRFAEGNEDNDAN